MSVGLPVSRTSGSASAMNLSRDRVDKNFPTVTTKAIEMKTYLTCTILAIAAAALLQQRDKRCFTAVRSYVREIGNLRGQVETRTMKTKEGRKELRRRPGSKNYSKAFREMVVAQSNDLARSPRR